MRFLGIILLVAGVGIALAGVCTVCSANVSKSWPKTRGQITRSEVLETHKNLEKKPAEASRWSQVVYEYVVDGKWHNCDRIGFGKYEDGKAETALEVTARYPKGAHVVVHYDPADPGNAVLEAGAAGESYGVLALGGLVTIVGVMLTAASFIRRARR